MKKKKYIQPKVNTERMQICNILAGSIEGREELIIKDNDGQEEDGGDAKMFGRFGNFEDEDF